MRKSISKPQIGGKQYTFSISVKNSDRSVILHTLNALLIKMKYKLLTIN